MLLVVALAASSGNWAFQTATRDNGELAHFAASKSIHVKGQDPMGITIMQTPSFEVMALVVSKRRTFCADSCLVTLTSSDASPIVVLSKYQDRVGDTGAAFYALPTKATADIMQRFEDAGSLDVQFNDDPRHQIYHFSYAGYAPDRMK